MRIFSVLYRLPFLIIVISRGNHFRQSPIKINSDHHQPRKNMSKFLKGERVFWTPRNCCVPLYRRLADDDDELSEVQPDAVPPEVREWLASTFTRQLATTRRKSDEKPKFRSVAHAIRAGIFVDRIYRRVSNTALMQFPPDVVRVLKVSSDISTDPTGLLCNPDSEVENMSPSWEGSSPFETSFLFVSNVCLTGCGK